MMRFVFLAVAIGIAFAPSGLADENVRDGWAEDNVRTVQEKLRDGGFYSGEIDGAYSSDLALALTRYQIRKGLPITGQLDAETSKALDAKPAVATTPTDRSRSSETWRRLRTGEEQTPNNARVAPTPRAELPPARVASAQSSPASSDATIQPETQPTGSPSTEPSATNMSTEQLRDYVGAFVLAGLDPHVGSETDFFAERVQYYDEGVIGREKNPQRFTALRGALAGTKVLARRRYHDGAAERKSRAGHVSAPISVTQRWQTFVRQDQQNACSGSGRRRSPNRRGG